jgi:uncharacterized protein (DUF2225 family)
LGKTSALRRGIVKGIQHTASVVLPKTFRCPVCKYEFKAYDVAVESKESGKSPEELVAGHILGCIGSLTGQAQCPDCGKMVKAKDFKEHMDTKHPIDPTSMENSDDHAECDGDQ